MTKYAIMFHDRINSTWKMNWEPTRNMDVTDADVKNAITYIQTGAWPEGASTEAHKCYEELENHVLETVVNNAFSDAMHLRYLAAFIECLYQNGQLSPKSRILNQRVDAASDTVAKRKLYGKLVKAEKIFKIMIDTTRAWSDEELATFACCLCGKQITDENGHNPYPVREESWYGERDNRCCAQCNYDIVVPVRVRFGRNAPDHRKSLLKMGHEELITFVA